MARPRLLFVSPRFLFPMNEGGKIRTANILRHLKGGRFELVLVSPAPADLTGFETSLQSVCDRFVSWPLGQASHLSRLLALPQDLPVSVATDRSKAGRTCVAGLLAEHPEVVVVDFPHAAVLLPERLDGSASVIFTHNVEAEIFERHAQVSTGIRRLLWKDQSRKMRKFEEQILQYFDAVIAVSRRDADGLRQRYGLDTVEVIDTGVDLDFFDFSLPSTPRTSASDGGSVVFVAAMDSPANIDGATFFLDEVWPMVARRRPQAQAVIVGRNPPRTLQDAALERKVRWRFTGFVDDIRPFVRDSDVAIIPLRVGSGTRIKAFEAMAMGRPVVSTRLGIEGLLVEPDQHYLTGESGEEFAGAILRLLDNPMLRDQIASAARKRLEERFSWTQVARQFEAICERAMARSAAVSGLSPTTLRLG